MKKAYITGISGFAGSYLAEFLLQNDYRVGGTHISDNTQNIDHIKQEIELHKVDLMDMEAVERNLDSFSPDIIFHLAALTSPAESFKDPSKVFTNNIAAQLNLFEAVRKSSNNPRILITSSAEIYGLVTASDLPISEDTQMRPGSPYAVSKIAQDYLGLQYNLSYGMDIIRVRPFNHIGPRQTGQFVVASFAKQIAEIEKNGEGKIRVGNLEAKRDFTDVRDMVKAYEILGRLGAPGEAYNAGSGVSHKISQILYLLLENSKQKIEVEIDPSKLRPSDVPDIRSDNTKIEKLGWKPEIELDKTLKDTLDYWRDVV